MSDNEDPFHPPKSPNTIFRFELQSTQEELAQNNNDYNTHSPLVPTKSGTIPLLSIADSIIVHSFISIPLSIQ